MPGTTSLPFRFRALSVGGALALGFAARRWPWGQLGLAHFDEGIYCLTAASLARTGLIDPGLIPYAPPGYPLLVGLGAWFSGGEPPGLLISALTGTATILVAAWVAQLLFGDRAAITTAWAVALAGPHLAFSRMALTDATFLLAWMIGLGLGVRFLRAPTLMRGLVMGVAVGLAQQVKYNGWLLGAWIVLAATVSLARPAGRQVRQWGACFGFGLVGAGGAALIVLPWFLFVEGQGGYTRLLAHQRSYLDPPALWWPNLRSQAAQALALASPLGLVGAGVVALGLLLVRSRPGDVPDRWSWRIRSALIAGVVGLLLGSPCTVGLILVVPLLRDADPGRWLLAMAWLGMGLLTPFYHPYARLWLPFEAMHWLLLGALTEVVLGQRAWDRVGGTRRHGTRAGVGLVAGSAALGLGWMLVVGRASEAQRPALLSPANQLEAVARQVADRVGQPSPPLLTLVRPAATYYLASRLPLRPQSGLDPIRAGADGTAWVLIDSAVLGDDRAAQVDRDPASLLPGRSLIAAIPAPLTLTTALDLSPRCDQTDIPTVARFWLYGPSRRTP